MIENINIDTIILEPNYLLVKNDLDNDFKEIPGPEGTKVVLFLGDFAESRAGSAQNIAIKGTILKACIELSFHVELKAHEKGKTVCNEEFEALMRSSMPFDVDLDVKEDDRVIYDFKNGLQAEEEGRLFKDEKHGYVMLMRYDTLYAKEVDEKIIPLNGYVFFIRDQKPSEYQLPSGLWMAEKVNKYGIMKATVVCADKPVREYVERKYSDSRVELKSGDRIIVQPKFGHRISSDIHAGKLLGWECIKRKNILCKVDEDAKTVQDYFVL